MFIQGNLQVVFDALFSLGVIDPVLKSDWTITEKAMGKSPQKVKSIIRAVNQWSAEKTINQELMANHLKDFDYESLSFLALEVAREFVDYTNRETLH